MVEFKTKVYYEDNNNIVGAEVTVYSSTGEEIDSIQVTSKTEFDALVERLDGLDEVYLAKSGLQAELNNITIDANTIEGFSPNDFAAVNHSHADVYAVKNHANSSNIYGVGSTASYGHVKCINGLSSSQYVNGEALSAYQGKVLNDKINAKVGSDHSHGWTNIVKDRKISGLGTCSLYINKNIRIGYFYVNITTSKTLSPGGEVKLYTNANYGTAGGLTSIPLLKEGMVMYVDNAGEFRIRNVFTKSSQVTGTTNYSLIYFCKA